MTNASIDGASGRETIKVRIAEMNRLAQIADTNMRTALRSFSLFRAYAYKRERDRYNAEAARLTKALTQPVATGGASTSPAGSTTRTTAPVLSVEQQRRLNQIVNYEIPQAEKMLAEYRRYNNAQKIAEWEQKLRVLNAERARLDGGGTTGTAQPLTPAPATPTAPSIPPAGNGASSGNFIIQTGKAFLAAQPDSDQDIAHNAILVELLNSKYSEANIALDDPFARAYREARRNHSGPLHWIRNQGQLQALFNTFPPAGSLEARRFPRLDLSGKRGGQTFFIRDFMQFKSAGNASLANLIIVDDAANSAFANDFDRLAAAINEYIRDQGETRREVCKFKQLAHRDALQLIPETENGLNQFAGAVMRDVSVSGNVIYSEAALQGIFATDGIFKNLHLRNNHLRIGGKHTISISGMLSGSIMSNTDTDGNPLPADKIQLHPLRLGGGANIYIIGFRNQPGINHSNVNYYSYEDIPGLPAASDLRRQITNPKGIYFRDVDMYELKKRLAANPPPISSTSWVDWISFWNSTMAEMVRRGLAVPVRP